MPQKTNLNINPYFDDFDKDDNFYKVLFKPGFPIQARELTTLQSILQNQVEKFGSHIFKEGSMVIPGNVNFDGEYPSVRVNADHLGIDVSVYADKLVGKKLRGQTSGVVAVVDKYLTSTMSSDIDDLTLFVKYGRGGEDGEQETFSDGEVLIVEEGFTYGNTSIDAGDTVATLVSENATSVGTAASIGEGVFFIRGTFVDVATQKIVLDPYTNTPSYRIGLTILEEVISAKEDDSLYDNAKGFSNFAAPGADRLKISLTLSKKSLKDYDDKTFVEILRVENGEIKKLQNKSTYSIIKDYFAKRTFEESGDYSIGNYDIEVKETLNDRESNEGIYFDDQTTDQGNTPTDDLMTVQVSPGKAYVRGYDIETVSNTNIDVEKPRDKGTIDSASVPFELGTKLRVNNVQGCPFIGVNSADNTVDLHDERLPAGTVDQSTVLTPAIGRARVYSFSLTDATYSDDSTEWDLYLFDIQTFTTITVNQNLSNAQLPIGSYVKGVSSGASGYATAAGASNSIFNLTQTSGTFIRGEAIEINGTREAPRTIRAIDEHSIRDVKSVFQNSTAVPTSTLDGDFAADTVLKEHAIPGFSLTDKVDINGTTLSSSRSLQGLKVGDVISYQSGTNNVPIFNRVTVINDSLKSATVADVEDITNVCEGGRVNGEHTIKLMLPVIEEGGGLYARLDEPNVASVNLGSSSLVVSGQVASRSIDSQGVLSVNINNTGISSALYLPFDAERYSVIYGDGTIEDLTSDQVQVTNGGELLLIGGLTPNQTSNVALNYTVQKNSIQSKQKELVRSEKVTVDKSKTSTTNNTSGLTQASFYGMRVEDEEISLNFPDVVDVLAVYEARGTVAPVLDAIEVPSGFNLNTASVLGEVIIGEDGAKAQIVTRVNGTKVEIVYLNDNRFSVGETVTFQESNIKTTVQVIVVGNYQDITDEYTLDKGQREQFYDYSRIVKRRGYTPSRQLLIIFNRFNVPSNDNGDVYTVNSYGADRFKDDIPHLADGTRLSDTLDFRPRVEPFTSTTATPFFFNNRDFSATGTNPTLVVAPLESSTLGYDFYLPRIDRVVLIPNKTTEFDSQVSGGLFTVLKGVPAINPVAPENDPTAMNLATIELPAYLYDVNDAVVTTVDNRRYTMRDIGALEDRIETLEEVTSLSLLEVDTKTFQVRDADGLDRFKSGFFVDDFKDTGRLDGGETLSDVDTANRQLITPVDWYSLKPELALNPSIDTNSADFSDNLELLDSNVQKTGDLITLKYSEKEWITQPLASRVENVNPFNMISFEGRINLQPASDQWVRNIYVSGGTRRITGDFNGSYIETIRTARRPDTHIRSRNVTFHATGLRPLARHYSFFDGSRGLDIIPKLIEISMNSGTFSIGETVRGYVGSRQLFSARVVQPNHKTGPGSNPTTTYSLNPYKRENNLPTSYSASATVLNIDVESLSDEVVGRYSGFITKGMVLLGATSGAQATVSDIRLYGDTFGDIDGSFFFRDPLASPPPPLRFTTGTKIFKLNSSSTNSEPLKGDLRTSTAETAYRTSGIVDTYTQTRVVVRRPPPPPRRGDPLAQSFTTDETGAFLTAIDIFMADKPEDEKLTVEIRNMELGTPTNEVIQDFARVTLEPSQVNISNDGTVPTKVTFPSPVYLEPDTEYCVCLLSPQSNDYLAWVARMGEKTVNTSTLPDAESVVVTKQYVGGSLFKSQNGTIWTASQFEDLKFNLYKAQFVSEGTASFFNPQIDTETETTKLVSNPVRTLPRKLKVGIDTTADPLLDTELAIGTKVADGTGTADVTGIVEQLGRRIDTSSGVLVNQAGVGYDNGTHTAVPLYNITGQGSGAEATITVAGGVVTGATITERGEGYVRGDVLGITTANVDDKGAGAELSVNQLDGITTLYLTNVQGEAFATGQNLVRYVGNTATAYGSTDITSSSQNGSLYSGNVLEVTQFNHGMHQDTNVLTLADIEPNSAPTTITADLAISGTQVSVADTTIFGTYEGIGTSRGWAKINNEIVYYTSITAGSSPAGTLGISTRGVDSITRTHSNGDSISKYELNGVSLTRINTDLTMSNNAQLKALRDHDTYHVEIHRGDRASGDSQLSFTDDNRLGGNDAKGSRNIQFTSVNPQFNLLQPGETQIVAEMRTTSGTSAGGSEVSFVDQGFQPVALNASNELNVPSIVASSRNEDTYMTSLPKNRSFTLSLNMSSNDPNLSPVVDLHNAAVIYGRNRLNNPIENYASDGRVNSTTEDPHSATYSTREVTLKQPATSLKVLISGLRPASSDFRVLYKLIRPDSSQVDQAYQLFPGYNNLRDTDGDGFGDEVIDEALNNGRPDAFVPASSENEFRDYQFSVDNVPQFTGFKIKIVMNGTNEAKAPKLKDLRVIALA